VEASLLRWVATYFEDWLRWTGIADITQIRYHPTLTGATDDERRKSTRHRASGPERSDGHAHRPRRRAFAGRRPS
jgi:hypothetical protein